MGTHTHPAGVYDHRRTSYGDTPESLRDLSISLDNVGQVQHKRGQLDAALTAFTESAELYRLLTRRFGPPYADPDELAYLEASAARLVAQLAERPAQPPDRDTAH